MPKLNSSPQVIIQRGGIAKIVLSSSRNKKSRKKPRSCKNKENCKLMRKFYRTKQFRQSSKGLKNKKKLKCRWWGEWNKSLLVKKGYKKPIDQPQTQTPAGRGKKTNKKRNQNLLPVLAQVQALVRVQVQVLSQALKKRRKQAKKKKIEKKKKKKKKICTYKKDLLAEVRWWMKEPDKITIKSSRTGKN